MSETRIKLRWVQWNLHGVGKDRSPFGGGKFAYRGPVLYAHSAPVGRLLPTPKGDFVVLYKGDGWVNVGSMNKAMGEEHPILLDNLIVEDIGVFTRFDGDMIDEAALHERTRQLFIMEAAFLVEQAEEVPNSVLVNSQTYYSRNGKQLIDQMKALPIRYLKHANLFGLKWKPFPTLYLQTLESLVDRRSVHYTSATEVAKRERKAAREEAKKALGLDP